MSKWPRYSHVHICGSNLVAGALSHKIFQHTHAFRALDNSQQLTAYDCTVIVTPLQECERLPGHHDSEHSGPVPCGASNAAPD